MENYEVVSICNALVDILVEAKDTDIEKLKLTKGIMHLVDEDRQVELLDHFTGSTFTEELGGSSMNAIRTLANLGVPTFFAGMVGQDEFGRNIEKRLRDLKINFHLEKSASATGSCAILITPDGERTMNTNLGASRLFDENLVPEKEIARSRIFHFCGYQWDSEGQIRAITKAIQCARDNETVVSFDVADPFVVNRHKDVFLDLIRDHAGIVFANKEESKALFDCEPEKAVDIITSNNAIAVVKLGAEGALIGDGDTRFRIDPVPTSVVDTTAAGDMFAAGFLYGFQKNLPLDECGRCAALLASDVISRVGATVSDSAIQQARGM